jgi:transposase
MLHLSSTVRYYLYRCPADMRKGFDSLSGIVTSGMNQQVLDGSIFIFLNRNRTHIKLLLWEGDGFSLYYKRLEQGTYELPLDNTGAASMNITYQQLQFMLQGVALQKIEYRKRYVKT